MSNDTHTHANTHALDRDRSLEKTDVLCNIVEQRLAGQSINANRTAMTANAAASAEVAAPLVDPERAPMMGS